MDILIGACIFIMVILIIESVNVVLRIRANPEIRRVRKVLKSLSAEVYRNEIVSIMRKRSLSNIPWLNKQLLNIHARTPFIQNLDNFLQQADVTLPLGVFILLSIVLALTGFVVSLHLSKNYLMAIPGGVLCGILPFFYISFKKKRRMHKFECQLPDALDMIARALRAGHAFSSGLQMVAEEFEDPLGGEFETTVSQINFGVSFKDALKSLCSRVDCPDLKFFTISIIIQKQSGGNLAEILENISGLIRERFKLRSRIKALAAEGKLSAIILLGLPFMIVFALFIFAPDYIMVLFTDPLGRIMIGICLAMMFMGIMCMKKIIAIKV